MSRPIRERIRLATGDITRLDVDAVVTAANSGLRGGGGVDGAVHAAAGPKLLAECRTIGGCPTGEARITAGYRLVARHVIHAVGPVWHGGRSGEDALLRRAYVESLRLAETRQLSSIAFPCISTGVYGYPQREACHIAVAAVCEWLENHSWPREVVFCCYRAEDAALYTERLEQIAGQEPRSGDG